MLHATSLGAMFACGLPPQQGVARAHGEAVVPMNVLWRVADEAKYLWTVVGGTVAAVSAVVTAQLLDSRGVGPAVVAGVAAFAVGAPAVWVFARGVAEVLIRRLKPSLIVQHLPALAAGTADSDVRGSWWLEATTSGRAAAADYDRYYSRAFPGVVEQLRVLKRASTIERDGLGDELAHMAARWIAAGAAPAAPKETRMTDPIHTWIRLGPEFKPLLKHPLVQRLHEVRQLAFAFPAFPGGTHTRFAHSLGAAHLANTAMRRTLEAHVVYTAEGVRSHGLSGDQVESLINTATVAALLHDIGHPPLGHALDRFFGKQFEEGNAVADKKFLPDLLPGLKAEIEAVPGVRLDVVLRILTAKKPFDLSGWEAFIAALVASDLDVDRLDYLQRDAHFTGQQEGLLGIEKLIGAIRPFQNAEDQVLLCYDEAAVHDIEQFVYARDAMYLRCYEHPVKVVSEALAVRALLQLLQSHDELRGAITDVALLTDAQLQELVSRSSSDTAKRLFDRLFTSSAADYVQVAECVFRVPMLTARSPMVVLHELFITNWPTLLDQVTEIERRIASGAGVDLDDVVLLLPDTRLADDRKPALDLYILTQTAGGFAGIPLLDADRDESISEMLRRRKFVPLDEVLDAAEDPERIRALEGQGFSLLSVLREARFKLRLMVRPEALDRREALRDQFVALGARNAA